MVELCFYKGGYIFLPNFESVPPYFIDYKVFMIGDHQKSAPL